MQSKQQSRYSTKPLKQSVVKKTHVDPINMTKIPTEDLEQAYRELNTNAFKILTYYYSKGDGWIFKDQVIADLMGLKVRTVQNLINELEAKGYLLQQKGKISLYIVGKKLVGEYS
ncbi:MAG: helix-turn-helix domain-containing protein [Candidatus Thiodiazotropha taylori]|nr:helix-turn-helix domain-containing protein [Candidatus Thiodiazotropha taylori]